MAQSFWQLWQKVEAEKAQGKQDWQPDWTDIISRIPPDDLPEIEELIRQQRQATAGEPMKLNEADKSKKGG